MFASFSRSFHLVKESWTILKKDKELLLFPLISGILTILLFFSFIVPLFVTTVGGFTGSYYLFLFLYYLISYFIIIFFNTGLIACASIRLNGKNPTFSDGFSKASKHVGSIFIWALISATVGFILRVFADKAAERSNIFGSIILALIGMAWSILTFFVVPVMIFENKNVFAAIKRSGALFKQTWGENVIGQFSLGLFFFILGLLGLLPFLFALLIGSGWFALASLPFVILYWVFLGIVSASLNGIFTAALYTYAATGKVTGFREDVVKHSFVQRPAAFHRGII